jgi:hypothetical protein
LFIVSRITMRISWNIHLRHPHPWTSTLLHFLSC